MMTMGLWINTYLKFYFLLTPFWVLSTFLSMTQSMSISQRHRLAIRVTLAVVVACTVLIFAGNAIFEMFDITIDSFRIGAGALLFLMAVTLVQAKPQPIVEPVSQSIAVVPLAIPIMIGPATTGALLVMGTTYQTIFEKTVGATALLAAILTVGVMLYVASSVERFLGQRGLNILSKLTGLVLAALAAQFIMVGIRNMLFTPGVNG